MAIFIRREQLDAFSSDRLEKFRKRAAEHVNRCWPRESRALGEDGVRTRIDESIEDAEFRGLQSERDLILFIDLVFLLGPNDRTAINQSWINEIFSNPDMSPPRKLKVVWRQATKPLRAGGGRGSNEGGHP